MESNTLTKLLDLHQPILFPKLDLLSGPSPILADSVKSESVQTSIPTVYPVRINRTRLPAARSEEEYAVHLAALEWSLADPIVINGREDIKSLDSWKDRFDPYEHQVQNLFTFCRRLPVSLLADDVGLGKTIGAGLILAELIKRGRVKRALVVCPKILADQWVEELAAKFGVTAKTAYGANLESELRGKTVVVVTTYDSVRNRLEKIEKNAIDMLILDEAHKLRRLHGNDKPPQVAVNLKNALADRLFKYVLMLTATPIQNCLWDLYSLIDCLSVAKGHQNPLGLPADFEENYIQDPKRGSRKLIKSAAEEFKRVIRQYLVRTRREDANLVFPKREVKSCPVKATSHEVELIEIVKEIIEPMNPLQQSSVALALMSSPQALATQLENMVRNTPDLKDSAAKVRAIASKNFGTAKLHGLLEIVRRLRSERPDHWRVVVFTRRKETQNMIGKALETEGISVGFIRGGEPRENQGSIKNFRQNPPKIHIIVSTDAGAEGINLQVANVLVNYDLPWNPMVVEQRIGRIQRLASTHANVIVFNLYIAGSAEEKVVGRLVQKLQTIAETIGDIEAVLESANLEGTDQDENSFETAIRKLVVKSLLGQDIEQAAKLKEQSIEKARNTLAQQRNELENTLGRLTELHKSGPRPPQLAPFIPSVSSKDFVIRGKTAEGARIEKYSESLFKICPKGQAEELIAFDEATVERIQMGGVFSGNGPRLYMPGKRDFERFAQQWADRAGHYINDGTNSSSQRAKKIAKEWCKSIPGAEFLDYIYIPNMRAFQGSLVFKTKIVNAVDSYEKLLTVPYCPVGHSSISLPEGKVTCESREIVPHELVPAVEDLCSRSINSDADLGEFVRFYTERLNEEFAKAGDDDQLCTNVRRDLEPNVFSDVVAIQGSQYDSGQVKVRFRFEGSQDYEVLLDIIPCTGQITHEPAQDLCHLTGKMMPASCLALCEISQQKVLSHHLIVSEVSTRRSLAEYTKRCPFSGKRVLQDEIGNSDYSSKEAAFVYLQVSPVTQRRGLSDEFVRCQFTNSEVLRDEVATSEVSEKIYRFDQQAVSVISKKAGHTTEFLTCDYTHGLILSAESGKSDLSGRVIRKDCLISSEKSPGRAGAPDELTICHASGKRLLNDEVTRSVVSGHLIDTDMLVRSDRSGQLALPVEMVRCPETNLRLLPTEVDTCSITGKRVDDRTLANSECCNARGLRRLMFRCEQTGKLVLPREIVECEITHAKVLHNQLEACCVSGKMALKYLFVMSSVTGKRMLPDFAVRSVLGGICCPEEAVFCNWLEESVLSDQAGICTLTGLTFAKKFLNDDGEFAILRQMLDGAMPGEEKQELLEYLRQQNNDALANMKKVNAYLSPKRTMSVVCAELRSYFGLKVRYAGMIVEADGRSIPRGKKVVGWRSNKTWFKESKF